MMLIEYYKFTQRCTPYGNQKSQENSEARRKEKGVFKEKKEIMFLFETKPSASAGGFFCITLLSHVYYFSIFCYTF